MFFFSYKTKRSGFTLVEMLIVITIIATVIIMTLGYLTGVTKRGRDTRRKAELEQIRSALEMYRVDHLSSPPPSSGYPANATWETDLQNYIKVPQDPLRNSFSYNYNKISAIKYCLSAYLENDNRDQATSCTTGACTDCNGTNPVCDTAGLTTCNYCTCNP